MPLLQWLEHIIHIKKHTYNICNCVRSELKYSSLLNWIRVWRSHNPQSYFAEVIDECPQHTLSRGHFDSPFYPTTYPDNINACLGRILGPPSSTIRLQFYDLDVEYEQDCGYDYVMVSFSLQWRHNGLGDVSNHPRLDCLLIPSFGCRSKKNINTPGHWPLLGESTGDWWISLIRDQ